MIDKLRDEIIESEKARTDLMKWKLVLVSGIATVGLGLLKPQPAQPVLLALIPFVCLYVDVVCYHNEIRIMVIAQFLRTCYKNSLERQYEEHCKRARGDFSLEPFVLVWTTVSLSILVSLSGIKPLSKILFQCATLSTLQSCLLMTAGGIGVLAGLGLHRFRQSRIHQLDVA